MARVLLLTLSVLFLIAFLLMLKVLAILLIEVGMTS